MGTNIEFAKSLKIGANGTNKVSLRQLLLSCVILVHFRATRGDLDGIFISEFPSLIKSTQSTTSPEHNKYKLYAWVACGLSKIMYILLRKVNFALMIPNPNLDCSYVVFSFWPNLSLVVLIKLFL